MTSTVKAGRPRGRSSSHPTGSMVDGCVTIGKEGERERRCIGTWHRAQWLIHFSSIDQHKNALLLHACVCSNSPCILTRLDEPNKKE